MPKKPDFIGRKRVMHRLPYSTALRDWFKISFDVTHAHRDVRPPGGRAWKDSFAFADVERVCFVTADLLESDEVYVFVKSRPQSYVVPMEAEGSLQLFDELVRRGLFDAQLAITAASSTHKEMFCWPKEVAAKKM